MNTYHVLSACGSVTMRVQNATPTGAAQLAIGMLSRMGFRHPGYGETSVYCVKYGTRHVVRLRYGKPSEWRYG